MTTTGQVVRRTQAERRASTRAALLQATIDCLIELGYAGTTTNEVQLRAGVSRGALTHHFASKAELLLAAMDHLYEDFSASIRDAAATLPPGEERIRPAIRMLWDRFNGPLFLAAMELWVAARTDPQLLAAVEPLERQTGRETHRLTVEMLDVDESQPGARELVQATLDLIRGLGLANTISDDRGRRQQILDRWAEVLDDELPRRQH